MKQKLTSDEKRNRKNIVKGAKSHIKSIQVALSKFLKGSNAERDYTFEHVEKLKKYYLEKL